MEMEGNVSRSGNIRRFKIFQCPRKQSEIHLGNLGNHATNQREVIPRILEKGVQATTMQGGFENVA